MVAGCLPVVAAMPCYCLPASGMGDAASLSGGDGVRRRRVCVASGDGVGCDAVAAVIPASCQPATVSGVRYGGGWQWWRWCPARIPHGLPCRRGFAFMVAMPCDSGGVVIPASIRRRWCPADATGCQPDTVAACVAAWPCSVSGMAGSVSGRVGSGNAASGHGCGHCVACGHPCQ